MLEAKLRARGLLEDITRKELVDRDRLPWHALISYWIWLRISATAYRFLPTPPRFWADPSEVFATQLGSAIRAYSTDNYAELTEVICESFDWRTRIPRLLLK